MNKDKIKEKIGEKGNRKYLSAQEYHKLTDEEKSLLRETLEEDDDLEYDEQMRKLWPGEFKPKTLTWRRK